MSRWLIKSEPHVYPFSQLEKEGKTSWTGVRNYEARNNLRDAAEAMGRTKEAEALLNGWRG